MKYTPYSFSKQNLHETCPYKFKLNYIDKLRTEFSSNAVLEKGSYLHMKLEYLAINKLNEMKFSFTHLLPSDVQVCNQIFEDFINSEVGKAYLDPYGFYGVEVEFGVKSVGSGVWETTSYKDKGALFRGKIDHAIKYETEMVLLDWKSGKINTSPAVLQLIMYAVWCFLKFEEIQTVRTAFVYIEHGVEKPYIFKREHLELLKKKIAEKLYNIETDTEFKKRETALCDYCEYRKAGYCNPTNGKDFAKDMMRLIKPKATERVNQQIWYYVHPESGSAWMQDHEFPSEQSDGCVEEISIETWESLDGSEWDIDFTIQRKCG